MIDDDDFYYDDSDLDITDEQIDDDIDFLDTSNHLQRSISYEVLSEAEVKNETKSAIKDVVEVLGLPSKAYAPILLKNFNWNSERLIEAYTTDSERLCGDLGIYNELEIKLKTKKFNCPICMTSGLSGKNTFALGCGHRYCNTCWQFYLEQQITNGLESIRTKCPHPKCSAVVHEKAFKHFISPESYKLYKRNLNRSVVFDNPFMKFCPAPNCKYAIKCERKNRLEAVTCKCGFSFCFQCADFEVGDHMPATCDNVQSWLLRASSESENIKWMMANTKKCPQCRNPIEKNGGCMHMTCSVQVGGCGHEFCWLCRGPWSEHGKSTGGFFACNGYTESAAQKEDQKNLEIKTELEAYMFYYHRYEAHRNAMKVADVQRSKAEDRANKMIKIFKVRVQDVAFLKESTEQLIKNRRVLQWSYVYGFYLRNKPSEKVLFEYLQEDLELHTDHLSGQYEKKMGKKNSYQEFMDWKSAVTNYTRVTANFLEKFVQGVMGGLTTDAQ